MTSPNSMLKVSDFSHQPVLLAETIEALRIRPDGCYVDCTVGGGGHAAAVLSRLSGSGRLLGLDQDADALNAARQNLQAVGSKAEWVLRQVNFADLETVLADEGITEVDGILADLGVSSWQLDQPERGFSYVQPGPLDMRMDRRQKHTAADLVNGASAERLTEILREYGEERYAGRISAALVRRRDVQPFTTTADLAETVVQAIPAAARREPQHPARRTFQALRIAVNDELGALRKLLAVGPALLRDGGRLCVITFHSLEDRMVKDRFRELEQPCVCPRDFPVCRCGRVASGIRPFRKAISATEEEQRLNPRARSAHLRCFERWNSQKKAS